MVGDGGDALSAVDGAGDAPAGGPIQPLATVHEDAFQTQP